MSDKPHPHDPHHPAMPSTGGAYPPQAAEGGAAFGSQAYGPHDGPIPSQEGYPEYGGYNSPYAAQAYFTDQRPRRPGTVLAGCIMAWLGSAVGIFSGLLFLSVSEESAIFEDVELGMSRSDAVTMLQVTGAFLLVWCLAVAVLTVFAFRGARWAGITLFVMAGVMVVLSVVNLVASGNPQGIFGMAWALMAAVLIYQNTAAKQWFTAIASARAQQP